MARPLRIEYPGAVYHVTSRGNEKKPVFKDDHDRDMVQLSGDRGKTKPHPSLTTDWVLGQFSRKRGKAEQEYRQFVHWGIGQKTIWTEVRGQSLLGEDAFMDKLTDHLKKHKNIPEIPRSQRYATRPTLVALLPDGIVQDQKRFKRRLSEAVE